MIRKNREHGYTLIELMISLLVIGIIAVIAVPTYNRFHTRNRVRSTILLMIEMKKAMNDLANECKGFPMRSVIDDEAEFVSIIDRLECDGSHAVTDFTMKTWPKGQPCAGTSLGKMMGVEGSGGDNAFCQPACTHGKTCAPGYGINLNEHFYEVPGDPCTPTYATAFGGKSPGWNYRLLASDPRNQPVAVLCGIVKGDINKAIGYAPVKIIINSGGFYSGVAVQDGAGVYDITGVVLPNRCLTGPYCVKMDTGETGCCKALGYRF